MDSNLQVLFTVSNAAPPVRIGSLAPMEEDLEEMWLHLWA